MAGKHTNKRNKRKLPFRIDNSTGEKIYTLEMSVGSQPREGLTIDMIKQQKPEEGPNKEGNTDEGRDIAITE